MLSIPPTTQLWYGGAVDLRLGFDGLYGADVGKLKHSAYKSDAKEIVGRAAEYNRKYR